MMASLLDYIYHLEYPSACSKTSRVFYKVEEFVEW